MADLLMSRAYPESLAGGFTHVDGTVQFYTRVNALLRPDMTVVDFGAGRGAWYEGENSFRRSLVNFRGKVRSVVGVDVDPVVLDNPSLDEALVFDGRRIPLDDASVDLVVADHVFEHLPDPDLTATELDRILVPGGWLCVRTPSKYGYVALANTLIPEFLKSKALRFAQPTRLEQDVFKTYYRINTVSALGRYFPNYQRATYRWNAEPAYHGGKASLFWLMYFWHALSPPPFKQSIFAFLQKAPIAKAP